MGMKILVTGINGQLGHDVLEAAAKRGHVLYGTDITDEYSGITKLNCELTEYVKLDIGDEYAVKHVVEQIKPDAVVHCAAWTAVDKAEDEKNSEVVMRVNGEGTYNFASACAFHGCKMIYLSTDYVFDGEGTEPWKPDDENYSPLNRYGSSKLMGENVIRNTMEKYFIVRISWVYGINGGNFVKTMLKLSKTHDTLRVVDDQIGLPTYTRDLSELLCDMLETENYGTYHACNTGDYISWYDFASEILKDTGVKVIPVSTEEYGVSTAARPKNSRLDTSKLTEKGFRQLPEWKDALERYMKEVKQYGAD
jgi:dTDP-4-dehydrorhamnose reductase